MFLLDVNFTFGGSDRDRERRRFWERLDEIGAVAWASETQCYLYTSLTPYECARLLEGWKRRGDFLKLQQVGGAFLIDGDYPADVDALLAIAAHRGIITFHKTTPRLQEMLARLQEYRAPQVMRASDAYGERL